MAIAASLADRDSPLACRATSRAAVATASDARTVRARRASLRAMLARSGSVHDGILPTTSGHSRGGDAGNASGASMARVDRDASGANIPLGSGSVVPVTGFIVLHPSLRSPPRPICMARFASLCMTPSGRHRCGFDQVTIHGLPMSPYGHDRATPGACYDCPTRTPRTDTPECDAPRFPVGDLGGERCLWRRWVHLHHSPWMRAGIEMSRIHWPR